MARTDIDQIFSETGSGAPGRSPIETRLQEALVDALRTSQHRHTIITDQRGLAVGFDADCGIVDGLCLIHRDLNERVIPLEWSEHAGWLLAADVRCRSYRLDLALALWSAGRGSIIAIECDGHDWHDRTKQQAAYDRARDRELATHGVVTLRFTGSEIFHSAERCASDAIAVMRLLSARHRECRQRDARDVAEAWGVGSGLV